VSEESATSPDGNDRFPELLTGGQFGSTDVKHKSELFENPNRVPVEINFIPLEPVSGRNRIGVMVVMPPNLETYQCHPPIIG
jgi:hypothetical protein